MLCIKLNKLKYFILRKELNNVSKLYLYINFQNFWIVFNLENFKIYINNNNTLLNLNILFLPILIKTLIYKKLLNYLNHRDSIWFLTLKFKGKGYRLKSNNKILNPIVGYSHFLFLLSLNIIIKKYKKFSLLFYSLTKNNLNKALFKLLKLKSNDPYTYNGILVSNLTIKKKNSKKQAA